MTNKNVRNFEIVKSFTAGVILTGPEVKSIFTSSSCDLNTAFCLFSFDELYVHQMVITRYNFDFDEKYDSKRPRKLLLKRKELLEIKSYLRNKGLCIIPSRIYKEKNGKYKIDIVIGKHIKQWDKREKIKDKLSKQEIKEKF